MRRFLIVSGFLLEVATQEEGEKREAMNAPRY